MAGSRRDHTIRRLRDAAFLVIAFLALAGPALAWEFEMTGSFEERLRYFSRIGNNDLFGIATLQEGPTADAGFAAGVGAGVNAAFVGFAGPSTWNTGALFSLNLDNAPSPPAVSVADPTPNYLITRGGFSTWGCDAAIHDQKLTLVPTIKVNPAIRVHGVYTIGGYRNKYNQNATGVGFPPFERWYMHDSSPNAAYNTASIGSWEQFRATFTTPWAIFSIGVKDFPLGTGANLAYNTRANAVLLVVPYGPFRFLGAVWLTDGGIESYPMSPDRERGMNRLFEGYMATYRAGNMEIGGGVIWAQRHFNVGNGPFLFGVPVPAPVVGTNNITDLTLLQKLVYFKFFNGRLFANGEFMWNNIDVMPIGLGAFVGTGGTISPAPGVVISLGATQQYQEFYNVFAEAGMIFGPSKVSLVWAQTSGAVLNNLAFGIPGNLAVAGINPKRYGQQAINYQALEPYEWLMFNTYAGGTQTFHQDGTGQMVDAYAFAGRYDYAVASNLNIWGSYIWAHRLEKAGIYFGQFASSGQNVGAGGGVFTGAAALRGLYGGSSPFVENGFIGWEANAGVDWKLLEGLIFKTRYAYWQPGDYFKEAWRAIGLRDGVVVNNAMFLDRDPIHALQGSFLIDF